VPSFKLEGRAEVLQALRKLGDRAPAMAVAAVKKAAPIFSDEIRRRAPVRTGLLKANISEKVTSTRKVVIARSGPLKGIPDGRAVFTEYGFLHNRTGKRIPPRPFMRPAFESKKGEVEASVVETLSEEIARTARASA